MASSPLQVRSQRSATLAAHAAFTPTGVMTVILGPLLPSLMARWTLTDAQAGDLFTAQFATSTLGVFLSGVLVSRFGYRLAIALGVALMGVGAGLLPFTAWPLGLGAVACWGMGLGLTIPACNLLVAEVHAARSAAALNLLNFSWSTGAVASPLMLAPFERRGSVFLYLELLAVVWLLLAAGLAALPLPRPQRPNSGSSQAQSSFAGAFRPVLTRLGLVLASLFFLYTGVENAVGGWLASYAKRLSGGGGTLWVAAPSFFYFALLIGRGVAPVILRRVSELRLARIGLCVAVVGILALLAAHTVPVVLASASIAGFGLASVYPVTIAMMTRTVGRSSASVASVMFALAGLGAAAVPWLVGFESTAQASLKFGLGVALVACAAMLLLYLRKWPEPGRVTALEDPNAA